MFPKKFFPSDRPLVLRTKKFNRDFFKCSYPVYGITARANAKKKLNNNSDKIFGLLVNQS